jgi:cysteine-S-conjugate beta-lyase
MEKYDFNTRLNRVGTNCFKWDGRKKFLGYPDVLPMHVADTDFLCAPEIVNAIQDRAAHPSFGYTIHDFRHFESLSEWLFSVHQWEISLGWCLHSPSIVTSLSLCIFSLTEENAGVIIQTPIYPPFMEVIRNNNRSILVNRLKQNKNGKYEINYEGFEELCKNKKAKLFILCSPHNPVGRVWQRDELLKLSEICLKYNIIMISDEIHSDLVYCPNKHINLASLDKDVSQNTITCISPSKTFNLPGISSSALIIENKDLKNKISSAINRFHLDIPSAMSITSFESAYRHGYQWYQALMKYLEINRSLVENWATCNLDHSLYTLPEATYLAWLPFKHLKLNDGKLKKLMYENAKVALDAGAKFGEGGEGFMRLNFGCPRSQLEEALQKIENALNFIKI